MYKQRQAKIHEEHLTVTKALHHINRENKLAMRLQKQLEHELIVLEERKDVRQYQDDNDNFNDNDTGNTNNNDTDNGDNDISATATTFNNND